MRGRMLKTLALMAGFLWLSAAQAYPQTLPTLTSAAEDLPDLDPENVVAELEEVPGSDIGKVAILFTTYLDRVTAISLKYPYYRINAANGHFRDTLLRDKKTKEAVRAMENFESSDRISIATSNCLYEFEKGVLQGFKKRPNYKSGLGQTRNWEPFVKRYWKSLLSLGKAIGSAFAGDAEGAVTQLAEAIKKREEARKQKSEVAYKGTHMNGWISWEVNRKAHHLRECLGEIIDDEKADLPKGSEARTMLYGIHDSMDSVKDLPFITRQRKNHHQPWLEGGWQRDFTTIFELMSAALKAEFSPKN